MKVSSFKVTRGTPVSREHAEKSGQIQPAGVPSFFAAMAEDMAADEAQAQAGGETETGARGRRRVTCPYCYRTNICWVSAYRYYYYSCWYCGNTFCI